MYGHIWSPEFSVEQVIALSITRCEPKTKLKFKEMFRFCGLQYY